MKRKHTAKTSVIASLGLAGIATAAGLGGQQVQAHADNTTGGGSATVANAPENPTVKQYPNKGIIDDAVNQAKGQEGLNINKTPDQNLNANNQKDAENQSKADYQNQAQKINQAKDQAKQQMDSYHSNHDQWVKEKQKYDQDLAKYNQDKAENEQKNKEIDSNNAEIDRKNAENKANYNKAMDTYNQAKANVDANNKKIDEDNAKAQADYNAAKAKYDQDKAKYDQDKAKYDQDYAKYQKDLNDYQKNANANVIDVKNNKTQGLMLDNNKHMETTLTLNNPDEFNKYYKVSKDNIKGAWEYGSSESDYIYRFWTNDNPGAWDTYRYGRDDWAKGLDFTLTYKNAGSFAGRRINLSVRYHDPTMVVNNPDLLGSNCVFSIQNNLESGGYAFYKNWKVDISATYVDDGSPVDFGANQNYSGYLSMSSLSQNPYTNDHVDGSTHYVELTDKHSMAEYIQGISGVSNPFLNPISAVKVHNDGKVYSEIDTGTKGWSIRDGDASKPDEWKAEKFVNKTGHDVAISLVNSDSYPSDGAVPEGIRYQINNGDWQKLSKFGEPIILHNGDSLWFNVLDQNVPQSSWDHTQFLYIPWNPETKSLSYYSDWNPFDKVWKSRADNHDNALDHMYAGATYRLTGTNAQFEIGDVMFEPNNTGTGPNWFNFSSELVNVLPQKPVEPTAPTPPTEPTINPHDKLDINPPVMTPDTPHQNNIPFTETPPTPPREEPQRPNPVNVDYHYDVYNYNSNVQKNFTSKSGQVTNNQVFVNGSTIYAQITGELPNASEMSDPLTVFTVNDDASQYANKAKFGGATILVDGQDHTGDFTVTDRGNGQITISLKNLSLAQGQSFVIMPHWTIDQNAELGPLTNKASVVTNGVEQGATPVTVTNFTPSIHKDVGLGQVQGDQGISVDGQTVANGTILTFPLTFKDPLPSNRNQDIVSTMWNDTLDSHYQYQGYKAYLKQDGKLVDVTDHIKLTQNGQQLHWEDDDYLRNYYNSNKGSQPTMPIIDLTVKVIGDNVKLIPNQFDITQVVQNSDGIVDLKTSSNTVHVSTYQPETHKDVELGEVDGDTPESVDGKTVVAGSVITFPMTISDLPANRSQNVASTTWTDTLDPNIEYHGYRAFLPDANGSLKDVSSMIHVQQNGQTLTITDDQQIRDLLNANKSQAQKQVILDIYGIVKETSQVIPNVFTVKQTFSNPDGTNPTDTSSTSNKVTVNVYKAQPVKDVQVGNAAGSDSSKSINGKMVADGQSVTFPLTIKNSLPANRSQKVIKTVWRDTLDRNLKYTGFNAVLDVNGQNVSVKDHIKIEQMGRTLVFTADDYLNNLLNNDLTKAQAQPIVDVYAEMTGTAKTATNIYQFEQQYTDGNGNVTTKTESNKVTVTTPQAPQPKKSVTDSQGHDITGKETKAGQTYEYHLNWDLSKYAHIVATDDMINKGFFFIDPIDTNAIELGDLSKATVTDSHGNIVPNMTIRAFHSISELPQYMQKEIRDNHLESQLGSTFLVALANNPKEFYKNYVQTGQSLRVNFPYRVKPGFVGTYKNTAWQFGFGHATPTNTVTNFVRPVPKATPKPTPAPAPAQQQAPRLPQTGNDNSIVPVIFGLSMFIAAAGYGIFRLLLALGMF